MSFEALCQPRSVFGHAPGIICIEERALQPGRRAIVYEINDRLDTEFEQPLQRAVGEAPVPPTGLWIHAVPGNAVAGSADPQVSHQGDVLAPAPVVLREFILVQRASRR